MNWISRYIKFNIDVIHNSPENEKKSSFYLQKKIVFEQSKSAPTRQKLAMDKEKFQHGQRKGDFILWNHSAALKTSSCMAQWAIDHRRSVLTAPQQIRGHTVSIHMLIWDKIEALNYFFPIVKVRDGPNYWWKYANMSVSRALPSSSRIQMINPYSAFSYREAVKW